MKITKLVQVLSVLLMCLKVVYAAPTTAELKVKGIISPGGCTVIAPDNGEYDFGRIGASQIKATGFIMLSPQIKRWIVSCDTDTSLVFKVVDGRFSSSTGKTSFEFGLGFINGSGKIGNYMANVSNLAVDGKAGVLNVNGNHNISNIMINTFYTYGWGKTNGDEMGLEVGKLFEMDLEVSPNLGSIEDMNGLVVSDVNLDGLLTLNFAYGI